MREGGILRWVWGRVQSRGALGSLALVAALVFQGGPAVARGGDTPSAVAPPEQVAACQALTDADFTGVVDAPTRVSSATFVPAHGNVPAYCEASGHVLASVGILLRLPASGWNGKFFERGCGGFCGSTHQSGLGSDIFVPPLRKGYAYLSFDGGHTGEVFSGMWGYNNLQGQIDFGFRAAHVAALAGKAITQKFYGAAPAKSYFVGCSSGGQQALSEAQRFPWDFDGIIAGAPSPTFSGPMMSYIWADRALGGTITPTELKLVHERAMARCDMDDGVKDGVIGDPLHCKFDPSELACKAGEKGPGCLTAAQVEAVRKVYAGPTTSRGEKIHSGGPLPGSELNWMNDEACCAYLSANGVPEGGPRDYFSYIGFMPAPGPGWKPEDFDFDRDYKRLRMSESVFGAADNPDLRKFKAAGGKLLLYQGGQDESDIPADSVDYYETVEKTLGGRAATQDFLRLFLVPGMNHCSGGAGAFAIDYLDYLETWVEKGHAPDKLIGAHVTGLDWVQSNLLRFPLEAGTPVSFTRPVYPYPIRARYSGHGDSADAANWGPHEDR
jgi:Tannase and feruloyl esterase